MSDDTPPPSPEQHTDQHAADGSGADTEEGGDDATRPSPVVLPAPDVATPPAAGAVTPPSAGAVTPPSAPAAPPVPPLPPAPRTTASESAAAVDGGPASTQPTVPLPPMATAAPPPAGPFTRAVRDAWTGLNSARGWAVSGLLAAATVGTALIMAVLVYLGISSRLGTTGTEAAPAAGITGLWAAIMGGGLRADADARLFGTSLGSASISLTIVSLGFAAVTAALVVVIVRHGSTPAVPNQPGAGLRAVLRSAGEGLVVAVVVTILTAALRPALSSGGMDVTVGGHVTVAFFGSLLLVGLVGTATRLSAVPPASARLAAWRSHLVEAGWYAAVPLAMLSFVALVGVVIAAAQAGTPGLSLLWLPLAVNVAGLSFGAAQFGGIQATAGGFSHTVHLWDLVGAWSILVIVLTFMALLWLAVFLGVRRGAGRFTASRIWQLPVLVFAGSLIATLVPLRATVSGAIAVGSASAAVGPAWETPLLCGVFALAVSVGAEVLPTFLARVNPRLPGLLAGRRAAVGRPAGAISSAHAAVLGDGVSAAGVPSTTVPSSTTPGSTVPGGTAPGGTVPGGTAGQTPITNPTLPYPEAAHAVHPTPRPLSRGAKTAIIATVSGVVGVGILVAAGFAAVAILNGLRDPAIQVRTYLDDIAAGHADAATAAVDPGIRNSARVLLTDKAFGDKTTTITVTDVTTTEKTADTATVAARYSLDGESFTQDFTLTPGPKDWLVLDTWKLSPDDALIVPVTVSGAVPDVTIGGVSVRLPSGADEFDVPAVDLYAYPGIYPVTVGGTSTFLEATGDDPLRVTPETRPTVTAGLTETAALKDAVLAKVAERAKACVTVITNMDAACPYALRQTDLHAMSLITSPPGFSDFGNGTFRTETGRVSTTADPTDWNPDPEAEESDFQLSGSYTIDGDDVTVSFDDSWW